MTAAELRDLSAEDLQAKAAELEESLFRMRMKQAVGQLERPLVLRTMRRDLARVKTVLSQKSAK
jgi:large subunit ribosomal protein L29